MSTPFAHLALREAEQVPLRLGDLNSVSRMRLDALLGGPKVVCSAGVRW